MLVCSEGQRGAQRSLETQWENMFTHTHTFPFMQTLIRGTGGADGHTLTIYGLTKRLTWSSDKKSSPSAGWYAATDWFVCMFFSIAIVFSSTICKLYNVFLSSFYWRWQTHVTVGIAHLKLDQQLCHSQLQILTSWVNGSHLNFACLWLSVALYILLQTMAHP